MEDESRVSEKAKLAVLSIVSGIILSLCGWAISIGSELSDSIQALQQTVAVLSHKVDGMPKTLELRIETLDEKQRSLDLEDQRLHVQIDRLEEAFRLAHPAVKMPPVRGYVD